MRKHKLAFLFLNQGNIKKDIYIDAFGIVFIQSADRSYTFHQFILFYFYILQICA